MTDTDPRTLVTFLQAVDDEVDRARSKFPAQEHTMTLAEWFAVLSEEVGGVARDINDTPAGDAIPAERLDHLLVELVQVAAMAGRMYAAVEMRR